MKFNNSKIILKIKEVTNEELVNKEIKIMQEARMPLVVQFYKHYYIEGANHKQFIVYEFENCTCN